MATLFNSTFIYYEIARAGYDAQGNATKGAVTSRNVRGTIQPLNANETAALSEGGDRQTGTVKIYSSERLAFRSQGNQAQGYVKSMGGSWYEIVSENPSQNGIIPHYKYTGSEIPAAQIPEGLQ